MMITPKNMPNHPIKPTNGDPLKKELEGAPGITLVTPGEQPTPPVKRPFVRKPYLTDRPFRDNEGLRELRKTLGAKPNINTKKK